MHKQFRKQEVEQKFKGHFWDSVVVALALALVVLYTFAALYGIVTLIRNFIV